MLALLPVLCSGSSGILEALGIQTNQMGSVQNPNVQIFQGTSYPVS